MNNNIINRKTVQLRDDYSEINLQLSIYLAERHQSWWVDLYFIISSSDKRKKYLLKIDTLSFSDLHKWRTNQHNSITRTVNVLMWWKSILTLLNSKWVKMFCYCPIKKKTHKTVRLIIKSGYCAKSVKKRSFFLKEFSCWLKSLVEKSWLLEDRRK